MSHVLCGGATNPKEVNTKHMVVSWEIPAQITKSLPAGGHSKLRQPRGPCRLRNRAEPPQCQTGDLPHRPDIHGQAKQCWVEIVLILWLVILLDLLTPNMSPLG